MTPTRFFDQAPSSKSLPSYMPPVNPPALRLLLDPMLCGMGSIDGAWWPYSDNAGEQLPILIAEIDRRLSTAVLSVVLPTGTWADMPSRIPARGRLIKVGWRRSADCDAISLHTAKGGADLQLIVVPAGIVAGEATIAFLRTTKRWNSVRSAEVMGRAITQDSISTPLPTKQQKFHGDDHGGFFVGAPCHGRPTPGPR